MAGRLEVICGPMFSGKSEEMIRRLIRHQIADRKVIVFVPEIDDRYEVGKVRSHSGYSFDAVPIPAKGIGYEIPEPIHVIAFDEAQFFGYQWLVNAAQDAVRNGKIVMAAGLDTTYRAEPFGAMPHLLAIADRVTKLTAICAVCKNEATKTQRLVDGEPAPRSGPTVQVGGFDTYEARCNSCWRIKG